MHPEIHDYFDRTPANAPVISRKMLVGILSGHVCEEGEGDMEGSDALLKKCRWLFGTVSVERGSLGQLQQSVTSLGNEDEA